MTGTTPSSLKSAGGRAGRAAALAILAWMAAPAAAIAADRAATPFDRALAREYRGLAMETARLAAVENGWREKARRSMGGVLVLPESPDEWSLPDGYRPALTDAHARLTAALAAGVRRTVPALAARAQRQFDCWLIRLATDAAEGHTVSCREAFFAALVWVEAAVTPIKTGGRFTRALTHAYLDYAGVRARDDADAEARHFAKKGLAAGEGALVMPETAMRWNLNGADELPGVLRARRRLVAALEDGGRQNRPDRAAAAQVMFDCWLTATAARRSDGLAEACHAQFLRRLADLESVPPARSAKDDS